MISAPKKSLPASTAERQLKSFIAKFSATDQALIRSVRRAMRTRLPTANELVWDNYNFLVIGYSPTERPSDGIFSIAARANGMSLFFARGAILSDPDHLLLGSGKQVRFIRLDSAAVLARRETKALMAEAIGQASIPLARTGRGKLIVRAISPKQRPRQR